MFTTRIRPKISANPLATMKSAPANVTESSTMRRNEPGSCTSDPKVVVRQVPPPVAGGICVMKRTYASAKAIAAKTATLRDAAPDRANEQRAIRLRTHGGHVVGHAWRR